MDQARPKKIVRVSFWKAGNGKEPVREWLKSLPKNEKRTIGEDLKTVERGWPIGMPLVRSLRNQLWEVRSTIPNGIARIIFKMVDEEMVLLHGFIKKSPKIPMQDLELALRRAKMLD